VANTVGLIALVNGMRAYLTAVGCTANVTVLGWKQRIQHLNQGPGQANRIALYPGLEPSGSSGAAGDLSRDHRPTVTQYVAGQAVRALVTWSKHVTMSVWAVDTSDTYDEEKQLIALENLIELAVQSVHNAVDPDTGIAVGAGMITWGAVRYTKPPTEMAFGLEALIEFQQRSPLFDQVVGLATPQASVGKVGPT